jgi:hypothetical protein
MLLFWGVAENRRFGARGDGLCSNCMPKLHGNRPPFFPLPLFLVFLYTILMLLTELGTPVETLRVKIYDTWGRL